MDNIQYKNINNWLPVTKKEVIQRGWEELDVILISGDAYIDHPSFGTAVIGRLLESFGLKVAIIPQPNWKDDLRDFKKLGKPRLFFGVTAGSMDSMVNHYTANKRLRSDDAYTPGGKPGFRPDYATIVYTKILKTLFPDTPVIIGGVEASLRRFTHYDYWSDQLKPSILVESKADLLVYGMGENALKDIAGLLQKGVPFHSLTNIQQTAFIVNSANIPITKQWTDKAIFSHDDCLRDKSKYAENFRIIETESNKYESNTRLLQNYTGNQTVIVNPSFSPISEKEMDSIYELPYTRLPHPKYHKKETIPAYEMIRHSITLHRGCFGGCSFCTISAHQGKFISSRSEKSILKEVDFISKMDDFKGYISDLGGPSANMYQISGIELEICKKCNRPSCIFPSICKNLDTNPKHLTNIYIKANKHPRIKKSFIGSGIRYDLFIDRLNEPDYLKYAEELIANHVSGRLKVAPEHTSDIVLKTMRKPGFEQFKNFKKLFERINKKFGLNQQLIPYFISSHPGCNDIDMAELAIETKNLDFKLEQVQDFTPTPMTLSTVMYYSGINPYTLEKVSVAKSKDEKLSQRKFFFWYKQEFKKEIVTYLKKSGRADLADRLFGVKTPEISYNQNKRKNKSRT
ncbi:MAG: YgiQ family radical SAM protein [Bacteroidetes bacterium GWC2_33_15]|nr:MAG: YgiQ family radical SAM protein [Bacteroidetes bacterium GWA2_33_15]OFX50613.1 MAG: YgiQ family radical SAM protein [Bacteroidetes bacterium GWC2_33_15]OFX64150.1 MAG: YgiQ family radical SAM protein [Bacteroidetes bacterium GWB2_32_14]OFX69762.1 MAG: YgiQ family radical SAM protein [Bacteroidetes bacterium GWD2_33_33]HAN19799.1 YgiQ family radical SAM protein [Bacteroidales bacterium]